MRAPTGSSGAWSLALASVLQRAGVPLALVESMGKHEVTQRLVCLGTHEIEPKASGLHGEGVHGEHAICFYGNLADQILAAHELHDSLTVRRLRDLPVEIV